MITIEKAIQDIELILKPGNAYLAADKPEALRLGIEAMKEVRLNRRVRYHASIILLPGETEES